MTPNFREHRKLARMALRAKRGQMDVSALGKRASVLYGHLTEHELEELALVSLGRGESS
ncbi:DUF3008 family protein [Thalassorhabdomicrobium marinisediminis]|uniref:DUF3008 family protein n=1 Tax=Thalassorhabdomicrobium marinisediminis TaxID=2170577 RepID=UPI0024906B02|nr:DUF3008 family protein [Thalassorhabdomicrobium marinisediminis]